MTALDCEVADGGKADGADALWEESQEKAHKDMTQVELAVLLGCSKQYLHKILAGERSGRKYMEAIARILGIEAAA